MEKLSVFIIALNEADRIATALESVKMLADEIIVVDSGSTDDTTRIAELHGARVLYNQWPGYGPQKKFAEDACRYEWVLNIDADEALSPEPEVSPRFSCWQAHLGEQFGVRVSESIQP
ncbi:MAG: glycosyltransferase family 2 protein [Xanthomonadales bacterium]|nr:glycosyltransferase family 2 protein [Xanthomonadales bacterium]